MASESAIEHRSNSSVPGGRWRASSVASVRAAFAREPGLLAVGVAGIGLAVLCFIAVAVRGRFIPPEGKMWDATTFTFGVAVFTLTIALLLPLAGYRPRARRRWAWAYCVFVVYGFLVEPIQAFRGLDPRFTEAGSQLDVIAGVIFGLTAVLNTVLFVLLALRFFRSDVLVDRTLLRLGIRYGTVAVALSFGVGIVMSFIQGRLLGDEGNLLLCPWTGRARHPDPSPGGSGPDPWGGNSPRGRRRG